MAVEYSKKLTIQDSYFVQKDTLQNNHEDTLKLTPEMFSILEPYFDEDGIAEINLYKQDYIESISCIIKHLSELKEKNPVKIQSYTNEFFNKYIIPIHAFFGDLPKKKFSIKLRDKDRLLIGLNIVEGKFSPRLYFVQNRTVVTIKKLDTDSVSMKISFVESNDSIDTENIEPIDAGKRIWLWNDGKQNDVLSFGKTVITMGSSGLGIGDMSHYNSIEDIKEAYNNQRNNQDGSIPTAYWGFKNVSIGDYIVLFKCKKNASNKMYHRLYGYAVVTSDLIYDENANNPYSRIIEWKMRFPHYIVNDRMGNSLFFQGTTDEEAKHIREIINSQLRNTVDAFSLPKWDFNAPLQQITYGAPGTGKSHGTEDKIEEIYPNKEERKLNVFRTTFHPDSDYSTFVGCYKPTKNTVKPIYGKTEIINKCKEYATRAGYNNQNLTQFGYDYSASILRLLKDEPTFNYTLLLDSAGVTDTSASSYISAGVELCNKIAPNVAPITYSFVPQAFTKAFIRAYELLDENKPVFLVIEEINRGNCAQIFGDLFQLLDREDDGYSKYAIKPDTDLEKHLIDELGDKYDVSEGMKLPPNLHIWATMNTSDQSLFPIDSAFKRRWEWKYVPISRKNANYQIEAEKDGKLMRYDWWEFLDKVNTAIGNATSSEDKKLGYFFCKADKKANETDKDPRLITADRFVGKVIFYLWNDVFKDYEIGDAKFSYTYKDGDKKDQTVELSLLSTKNGEKEIKREFSSFFDDMGNAKQEAVVKLMDELKIEGKEVVAVESESAPDSDFQV